MRKLIKGFNFLRRIARIIHDGSSRNRAVAKRDGHAESHEAEAYLKQYVEAARGEPVRRHVGQSRAGLSQRRMRDWSRSIHELCGLGWANVFVVAVIGSFISCSGMPALEEQERLVRANELVLHQLTPRAFVGAWGAPTYQHTEFMQFFGMKDESLIPRSRLASGEPPRGWEIHMESGDALFLAYPDRGWLVVFFEERLVYREALTAVQLHELGRSWKHEDKFRSRFEAPASQ